MLLAYLQKHARMPLNTATAKGLDTPAGRDFSATCSQCHALPEPVQHTAADWPAVVLRMQRNMVAMGKPAPPRSTLHAIDAHLRKYAKPSGKGFREGHRLGCRDPADQFAKPGALPRFASQRVRRNHASLRSSVPGRPSAAYPGRIRAGGMSGCASMPDVGDRHGDEGASMHRVRVTLRASRRSAPLFAARIQEPAHEQTRQQPRLILHA